MGACVAKTKPNEEEINNTGVTQAYVMTYPTQSFHLPQPQYYSTQSDIIQCKFRDYSTEFKVDYYKEWAQCKIGDIRQCTILEQFRQHVEQNDLYKQISNVKQFKWIFKQLKKCMFNKQFEDSIFPIIVIKELKCQQNELYVAVAQWDDIDIFDMVELAPQRILYCYAPADNNIVRLLESEEQHMLQYLTFKDVQQFQDHRTTVYCLNNNMIQNKHFQQEITGDCIIQLYTSTTSRQQQFQQFLNDFKVGFHPLSYNAIKQHLKRRGLKQIHLWALLPQVQDIRLIACCILCNYLAKLQCIYNIHSTTTTNEASQTLKGNLENNLFQLVQGQLVLPFYNRLICLVDLNMNQNDIEYLMNRAPIDVLQIALSNGIMLSKCMMDKFNITINKQTMLHINRDNNYYLSYAYLNNYKFIESQQPIITTLIDDKESAYWHLRNTSNVTNMEIYLPAAYYDNECNKYYMPSIEQLQISHPIHDISLLFMIQQMQMVQIDDMPINYLLLALLIQAFVNEMTNQNVEYHDILSINRSIFGHPAQSGTFKYMIEPFCLHRLSVIAHQQQSQDECDKLVDLYQYYDPQYLPCNNISVHKSYAGKDIRSILNASINGFLVQEWFMMRFNELAYEQNLQQSYGFDFTLQSGQLMVWGFNQHYQLGQLDKQVYRIPRVLGTQIRFRSIECGHNHCLAISLFREVYCWGDNEYGKSGMAISNRHVRNPTLVISEGAIQIGCGHDHSMYLNDKHIYAWGCGDGGLLGNNNTMDTHIPGKVHLMDAQLIKCGGLHSGAIANGNVYMWGRNEGGQLGISPSEHIEMHIPHQVEGLNNIVDIVCGDAHTIVIDKDGNVYGWGYNEQGQLCNNGDSQWIPQLIDTNVQYIYGGSLFTYLHKNGELIGYGQNDSQQLGVNQGGILLKCHVTQLSSGQNHTLCQADHLYGWGLNRYGELGVDDGRQGVRQLLDVKTQSLSCGGYHSAVVVDGCDKYFIK